MYHEFDISRGPPTLFVPSKAFSPAAPDLLDLVTANQLNEQTAPNWFPFLDFLLSFLKEIVKIAELFMTEYLIEKLLNISDRNIIRRHI